MELLMASTEIANIPGHYPTMSWMSALFTLATFLTLQMLGSIRFRVSSAFV